MTLGLWVLQSLTLSSNDLCYVLRTGHRDALRHILRLLVATLLGARGHDERGGQRAVGVGDGGGRGGRLAEARVQHGQLNGQLKGALVLEPALTEHSARHHTRSMSQCPLQNRSTQLTDRVLWRACVHSLPVGTTDWGLSGAPTPRGQLWACACAGGGGPGNFEMTTRHWSRRPLGGGSRLEGSKITPDPNSRTVDKGYRRQARSPLVHVHHVVWDRSLSAISIARHRRRTADPTLTVVAAAY